MKCELCHEHDAETVLYRTNDAGKQEELYVCHACAERERAFGLPRGVQVTALDPDAPLGNPGKPPADLDALGLPPISEMDKMSVEDLQQLANEAHQQTEALFDKLVNGDEPKRCPACGMTIDEIRDRAVVGCPKCYETFRKQILSLLVQEHRETVYKGDPKIGHEHDATLADLEAARKAALEREDYAEAARLDKEIKRLKGKKGGAQ